MENTYFLVFGFAIVFLLGFILGTIVVHREMDNLEEDIDTVNQQKKIKEVTLTVADSVAPPLPPPHETLKEKFDRERHERLQREEAARR